MKLYRALLWAVAVCVPVTANSQGIDPQCVGLFSKGLYDVQGLKSSNRLQMDVMTSYCMSQEKSLTRFLSDNFAFAIPGAGGTASMSDAQMSEEKTKVCSSLVDRSSYASSFESLNSRVSAHAADIVRACRTNRKGVFVTATIPPNVVASPENEAFPFVVEASYIPSVRDPKRAKVTITPQDGFSCKNKSNKYTSSPIDLTLNGSGTPVPISCKATLSGIALTYRVNSTISVEAPSTTIEVHPLRKPVLPQEKVTEYNTASAGSGAIAVSQPGWYRVRVSASNTSFFEFSRSNNMVYLEVDISGRGGPCRASRNTNAGSGSDGTGTQGVNMSEAECERVVFTPDVSIPFKAAFGHDGGSYNQFKAYFRVNALVPEFR
jgi:hypothetical protein